MAQYMEPKGIVQQVCNCPAKILVLLKEIMDLKVWQLLPPNYGYTTLEVQMQSPDDDHAEVRWRPAVVRTTEYLHTILAATTLDAYQSGAEVRHLGMQLPLALSLAVRHAPAASQQHGDNSQRFPDSTVCSGSDRTQMRE
jgi:hypothetical protein